MLYNRTCYITCVMLCYITCVVLCHITYIMLCYITYTMLCYITCVNMSCYVIEHVLFYKTFVI